MKSPRITLTPEKQMALFCAISEAVMSERLKILRNGRSYSATEVDDILESSVHRIWYAQTEILGVDP